MAIADGEDILAADILGLVSFETTTGTSHSLTTVASEKVLVIAKGSMQRGASAEGTVTLKYNSVTKDTVTSQNAGASASDKFPFCLTYTQTPGAATANITVESGDCTLANVVIMVIKLKQS